MTPPPRFPFALLLAGLLAVPAAAQHGTVVDRNGSQLTVALVGDLTVMGGAIGDVVVPETALTSAQLLVLSVDGSAAACLIVSESEENPAEEGYPVRFDRPVQQGTLQVTSEPAGAAIALDGARSGRTPARRLTLPPGPYTVDVTHAGYEPGTARVVVTAGEEAAHHFVLRPSGQAVDEQARQAGTVRLDLTSTPGNARIFVNGVERGYTSGEGLPPRPLELPADAPIALEIVYEKHHALFDTLAVAPGQVWEEHYTLEEKRAPLSVLVYPWGSDVFVDSVFAGRTPFVGTLPMGRHDVRITRPGFTAYEASATVWEGAIPPVIEATLQREAGWLRVRSGPPGAEVRLNGVAVGPTPLDLLVPPGRYGVEIGPAGASLHREEAVVGIGGEARVTFGTPPPEPTPQTASGSPPRPPSPTPSLPPSPSAVSPSPASPTLPPSASPTPPPASGALPLSTPAAVPDSTVLADLLRRGRELTEIGSYPEARAALLQAQALAPGNLDVARAIGEVDRVLGVVAGLSAVQREDVDVLRRRIREDALARDHESLQLAAQRLFEYVPRDPATLAALRRGLGGPRTPGNGPVLHFAYVFGAAERPPEEPALAALEDPPYSGFLLSATEITNDHFAEFLNEQERLRDRDGRRLLSTDAPRGLVNDRRYGWRPQPGLEQHPVVDATWYGAAAYAVWAGGRLPTPSEWVWASTLGQVEGGGRPGGNFQGTGGTDEWGETPAPVRQFAPDGLGLYDMAGNVWEWTGEPVGRRERDREILGGSFRHTATRSFEGGAASAPAEEPSDQIGFRILVPVD